MTDPKQREQTGDGGSSDGDTQPDDAGEQGTLGEHPRVTGEQKAQANREEDPPA